MFFSFDPITSVHITINISHCTFSIVCSGLEMTLIFIFSFINVGAFAIYNSVFKISLIDCSTFIFHNTFPVFESTFPSALIHTIFFVLNSILTRSYSLFKGAIIYDLVVFHLLFQLLIRKSNMFFALFFHLRRTLTFIIISFFCILLI